MKGVGYFREDLEFKDEEYDQDKDEVKCFKFRQTECSEDAFEEMIVKQYENETGPPSYIYDDGYDDFLPAYLILNPDENGLVLVSGPEPREWGDEILAFWCPPGFDFSSIKDEVESWCIKPC